MNQPQILSGDFHKDERGILAYNNNFDLAPIKRFYTIEHKDDQVKRAWQGHKREQKWFQVVQGSFLVLVIKPDKWEDPSFDLKPTEFILQEDKNEVLHVPGGFATGFKALEPNSKLLVFSDFTLEESNEDDYRFDQERWHYETFM